NTLYKEFARALHLINPKAFSVENVSGMGRRNYAHLLQDQLKVVAEAGYRVKHQVLNAAEHGVAQERRRIFIVGLRSDLGLDYTFPSPTHGASSGSSVVTIKDALAGMPEWPEGEFY
ncbi:DNA cytosine methyltransferase, partial [Streptobacillus ratti]|uniref:DNA cytosine methyltransferase n=1 Tax=Streptobacillus ratti TaxID=1720557 RepID=UPI001ABFE79B